MNIEVKYKIDYVQVRTKLAISTYGLDKNYSHNK